MAGPLRLLSVALEHVPETDENGQPYPWARPLQALSSMVEELVRRANATPWTTSRTVSASFGTGETKSLVHGLGRVPVRWAVEDITVGGSMFRRDAWDDKTITIRSVNTCTVTFRVE